MLATKYRDIHMLTTRPHLPRVGVLLATVPLDLADLLPKLSRGILLGAQLLVHPLHLRLQTTHRGDLLSVILLHLLKLLATVTDGNLLCIFRPPLVNLGQYPQRVPGRLKILLCLAQLSSHVIE